MACNFLTEYSLTFSHTSREVLRRLLGWLALLARPVFQLSLLPQLLPGHSAQMMSLLLHLRFSSSSQMLWYLLKLLKLLAQNPFKDYGST